jgi:hypothetical protein
MPGRIAVLRTRVLPGAAWGGVLGVSLAAARATRSLSGPDAAQHIPVCGSPTTSGGPAHPRCAAAPPQVLKRCFLKWQTFLSLSAPSTLTDRASVKATLTRVGCDSRPGRKFLLRLQGSVRIRSKQDVLGGSGWNHVRVRDKTDLSLESQSIRLRSLSGRTRADSSSQCSACWPD